MKKVLCAVFVVLTCSLALAQTDDSRLNAQLGEMKKYFLAGDYENFANYTYPKVIEMMGGKARMVSATQQAMERMQSEGFTFVDLIFKDPTGYLEKDGELQSSLTQQLTMNTPKGKIQSEYTLLAISSDKGQNWTFIDTSGKEKATMLRYFPNLHQDIVVKQKKQQFLD
ncbi:MAG: hypothetical protein AAGC43_02980 [Bacteroidota bacterium]